MSSSELRLSLAMSSRQPGHSAHESAVCRRQLVMAAISTSCAEGVLPAGSAPPQPECSLRQTPQETRAPASW
eukprot:2531219-Prymnesium_polylepis.1